MEEIIVSKVRVKILQLFLSSSEPLFHVREIVRRVDEEINAVRRELARMEKYDMVQSEWRANRRLYSFRRDYPYYSELLALVAKSSGMGIVSNRDIGRVTPDEIAAFVERGFQGVEADCAFLSCTN